jgi:hypothetical protein
MVTLDFMFFIGNIKIRELIGKNNILMAKTFKCGKIHKYEEIGLAFWGEFRFLLTE